VISCRPAWPPRPSSGVSGFGNWARLAAQQALTQDQLLQFDTFGNVTLIHITDIHAQLKPIWFREPE
jgi:S-sulfosulfanyl-L-cysteine sulfohydrolase